MTQEEKITGSFEIKVGLAEMLKGGVIMDVTTPEQAKIAEDASLCSLWALWLKNYQPLGERSSSFANLRISNPFI